MKTKLITLVPTGLVSASAPDLLGQTAPDFIWDQQLGARISTGSALRGFLVFAALLWVLLPAAGAAVFGEPVWTNRFNGLVSNSGEAHMAADGSGNVFVTGTSVGIGGYDCMTVAYSGAGVPLWTNRYNGLGNSGDFPSTVTTRRSSIPTREGSCGSTVTTGRQTS